MMISGVTTILEIMVGKNDPRTGEAPDAQFYRTETNFNLDLNEDGRIGPPS